MSGGTVFAHGSLVPVANSVTPRVAASVLEYFREHPRSTVDLEVVARWRLLRYEMKRLLEETERGLEWLVKRRQLLPIDVTGLARRYRLNPDAPAESKPARSGAGKRRARS